MFIACIAIYLGYVFVEGTWNEYAFELDSHYYYANLFFLSLVFSIVYLWGQQSRVSIVVFWGMCLLMGIANYYLVEFKGQPVVPADVLALQTALEVKEGYDLTFPDQVRDNVCLYLISSAALLIVPKIKLNKRLVITHLSCAIALSLCFTWYMNDGDIEQDFDCVVGEWETLWYYENQGTTLCFLKRIQDFFPDAPEAYSHGSAEAILNIAAKGSDEATGIKASASELPNVIIVMNESFADITKLQGVQSDEDLIPNYRLLTNESIVSGSAYASCFGAGTCNSEFEVLTGASMANLGKNVYPYVLYDLASNENLVKVLESYGYQSTAMHPAEAKNWRRDRVYEALGFDSFLDINDFTDAEYLRHFVSDGATYDKAIELISDELYPQLILDVTIQNHGGYTTDSLAEAHDLNITASGQEHLALSEYAACVRHSDADLAKFIENLRMLDEKTIVLFFGDHQPSLGDIPIECLYGKTSDEMSLDELEQMYEVPYLIWANYDTGLETGARLDTSLNYLGMNLINVAQLPLTPYLQFLESAQTSLPALNTVGYMSSDGSWHAYSAEWTHDEHAEDFPLIAEAAQTLSDYAVVQFANLFDAKEHVDLLVL
ncbi:MAG: LTA synthase family protein [Eggerthellaceae bacterium]|nr:LTA synthase family protein [Eggerthellaceae bacterium]